MMTIIEVERMTEALQALGLSNDEILLVQKHIATGMALPVQNPTDNKEPD